MDKVDSIWSGCVRDLELQGEISLFPRILHIFLVIRADPSRSGLIRVDPTRIERSGPTFVPASPGGCQYADRVVDSDVLKGVGVFRNKVVDAIALGIRQMIDSAPI